MELEINLVELWSCLTRHSNTRLKSAKQAPDSKFSTGDTKSSTGSLLNLVLATLDIVEAKLKLVLGTHNEVLAILDFVHLMLAGNNLTFQGHLVKVNLLCCKWFVRELEDCESCPQLWSCPWQCCPDSPFIFD